MSLLLEELRRRESRASIIAAAAAAAAEETTLRFGNRSESISIARAWRRGAVSAQRWSRRSLIFSCPTPPSNSAYRILFKFIRDRGNWGSLARGREVGQDFLLHWRETRLATYEAGVGLVRAPKYRYPGLGRSRSVVTIRHRLGVRPQPEWLRELRGRPALCVRPSTVPAD